MSQDFNSTPDRWSACRVSLFLIPLFLFFIYPLGFWPGDMGANESAHAYLAMALVDRGEMNLDHEVRDYFFNHDLVYRNGSYYSNKAPGAAFWLVPAAALLDVLTPGRLELVPLLYFGRILMLSLPFVLFLFILGRALERLAKPAIAWGLTLAYALGTNAGVYAVYYFSHDLAAMALFTAFLLNFKAGVARRLMGGLSCGLAMVSEYQVAGIVLVLLVLAPLDENRRFKLELLVSFVLGLLALAAGLLLYNFLCFGNFADIAYLQEFSTYSVPTADTYGFSLPDPVKLLAFAIAPAIGLFFHSPWLALIFPAMAAVFLYKSPFKLHLIGAVAASFALPVILSAHQYWIGGAATGPRYLTAGLPFMLVPIAFLAGREDSRGRRWPRFVLPVTIIPAVIFHGLILATTPHINTDINHLDQNPITTFAIPLLEQGVSTMTLAVYLGADSARSLAGFVLLFLLPVGMYAVSALRRTSPGNRFLVPAGFLAGASLFFAGLQIGTRTNPFSAPHLKRVKATMSQESFLREEGRVRFIRRASAVPPRRVDVQVTRHDPALDALLSPTPEVYLLAEDLKLIQGAVWSPRGYLLISDIRNNTIYKYTPDESLTVFLDNSGCRGPQAVNCLHPGSNGLAFDEEGGLVIAEYGNRRITRIAMPLDGDEQSGAHHQSRFVLAECHEGKRFNSPSALAMASDISLYFTDPPFGLEGCFSDPRRELDCCGIYRLTRDGIQLVRDDVNAPVGLAFSPDEKHLYVGDRRSGKKVVLRFDVGPGGTLPRGHVFFTMPGPVYPYPTDGLLVDGQGNVYATGNGGIWILSAAGKPLGFLELPWPVTSLAWGGRNGRSLYISAGRVLYGARTKSAE